MMRRRDLLAALACLAIPLDAQNPAHPHPLTLEDVVKLVQAGFSDDVIITKIKKNAKPFDLDSDELRDLKKGGLHDEIIKYLLDPSLPYTPPTPAATAAKTDVPAKKYPADPNASRVPSEPALYFFPIAGAAPVRCDLKLLLAAEQPKKLLKKSKPAGYLIAPSATLHTHNPRPVFYVRLSEGKEIEELVLVNLLDKNKRRELSLKPDGITPREALEVGAHLFRLTPSRLDPGEYLFFFVGSAETAKGIYGKGYDFAVD